MVFHFFNYDNFFHPDTHYIIHYFVTCYVFVLFYSDTCDNIFYRINTCYHVFLFYSDTHNIVIIHYIGTSHNDLVVFILHTARFVHDEIPKCKNDESQGSWTNYHERH